MTFRRAAEKVWKRYAKLLPSQCCLHVEIHIFLFPSLKVMCSENKSRLNIAKMPFYSRSCSDNVFQKERLRLERDIYFSPGCPQE